MSARDRTPGLSLVTRQAAAEATVKAFKGQAFAWGRYDCGKLAAHVVRGLGLTSPMDKAGRYRTKRAAIKALESVGFETLDAALDSMGFARIAPAETLPADILGFQSGIPSMGHALGVVLSNGRCLAFVDSPLVGGYRAVIGRADMALCAWRVL